MRTNARCIAAAFKMVVDSGIVVKGVLRVLQLWGFDSFIFRISDFGLLSAFGLRVSDFKSQPRQMPKVNKVEGLKNGTDTNACVRLMAPHQTSVFSACGADHNPWQSRGAALKERCRPVSGSQLAGSYAT